MACPDGSDGGGAGAWAYTGALAVIAPSGLGYALDLESTPGGHFEGHGLRVAGGEREHRGGRGGRRRSGQRRGGRGQDAGAVDGAVDAADGGGSDASGVDAGAVDADAARDGGALVVPPGTSSIAASRTGRTG